MKILWGAAYFFVAVSCFADDVPVKIVDAANGKPVDGAVAFLFNAATGKTTAFLPDNNGVIKFPAVDAKSTVTIKCIGYNDFSASLENFSSTEIVLTRNNIDLKEVAITSSYLPTDANQSVYEIKIITKDEIEKQLAVTVADVMQKQLNTSVSYDPVFGSNLSMQGLDMKNIKVLVDGVPVIGRMDGTIDLSQFNMSNVQRIEIIEGPMSAMYGTDAIGGVINIITKTSASKKTSASANFYYQSTGNYNVDAQTNFKMRTTSFNISAGRNLFDGWNLKDNVRVYEWKPKLQYFGSAGIEQTFSKWKLAYNFRLFDETITDKGATTITPYYAYAYDYYYKTFRHTSTVNADYFLNALNKINSQVAYSGYSRTKKAFRKDMVSLEEGELTGSDFRDTTTFNAWNIRSAFTNTNQNHKINYQAGIDFNLEKGSGKRIENNEHRIDDYAAFASAEIKPWSNFLIRPAVRYAYNTQFNSPLIPSVNLKYDLSLKHTLRLSYSRGFRAPGIKELYLLFIDSNHDVEGNENLKPETSNNYQGSYTFNFSNDKIKVKSTIKVFYNDVKNLITLAQYEPGSTLYTYINIGNYKAKGIEISNTFSLGNFSFSAGYAYTGRYASEEIISNNPEFSFHSEINGSADYTFKKLNTTLAVFYKYNGSEPVFVLDDEGNKTGKLTGEDYHVMDITLMKKFWKNKICLSGGMKNLFDVTSVQQVGSSEAHSSENSSTLILPGRSWFMKMQLNF